MNETIDFNDPSIFNGIANQNPDLASFNPQNTNEQDSFILKVDNDFYNSVASLSKIDLFENLEDPEAQKHLFEAINNQSINAETLSYDGIKAEVERRKAAAEAAAQAQAEFEERRMTLDVIDNHIDAQKNDEEEDSSRVVYATFGKPKAKKNLVKAA